MGELRRMLEAIHKENKDIIILMVAGDDATPQELKEIYNEVDSRYNKIFYGGKTIKERVKEYEERSKRNS